MKRLLAAPLFLLLVAGTVMAEKPKTIGEIERLDPAFDALVPKDAVIEVLADGFEWTEGPVWVPQGGYLLFCDIPHNRIHKWSPQDGLSTFLEPSGYTGKEPFTGPEPGTNGLMLDSQGRLTACAHGDRQVIRLGADGAREVRADRYEGERRNSPDERGGRSNGER